jgi:hypothetical protein
MEGPKTSNKLGDLKDELKEGERISFFTSLGPKTYCYKVEDEHIGVWGLTRHRSRFNFRSFQDKVPLHQRKTNGQTHPSYIPQGLSVDVTHTHCVTHEVQTSDSLQPGPQEGVGEVLGVGKGKVEKRKWTIGGSVDSSRAG